MIHLGPNPESKRVYVINQVNPETGTFDEHKVMLGYDSLAKAKKGYLENYEKGWKGIGSIIPMSIDEFKIWLKEGDKETEGGSQRAEIDKNERDNIIKQKGGGQYVNREGTEGNGKSLQDTRGTEEVGRDALEKIQAKDVSIPQRERKVRGKPKSGSKRHMAGDAVNKDETDRAGIYRTAGRRHGLGDDETGVDTSARGERGERGEREGLHGTDEHGEATEGNYRITDADRIGEGDCDGTP